MISWHRLVGIVSVFQNLRSTLLLPFHSMSSAYLPPPRGTLIGMFNAWVWSLAKVTAKASCTRSPCVRVNGMFNALVWSLDFDLRDMSNEARVSALLFLLFIEWRFCIDGVDWLFLFVSCFLIGSFSWLLIGKSAGNGDFWLVQFPVIWLVGHVQSVWRTKYPVLTLLISLKIVGQQIYFIVE